jgi:hypothetical protein
LIDCCTCSTEDIIDLPQVENLSTEPESFECLLSTTLYQKIPL